MLHTLCNFRILRLQNYGIILKQTNNYLEISVFPIHFVSLRVPYYKIVESEEIFSEEDEYHLFLGRRVSEIECEL